MFWIEPFTGVAPNAFWRLVAELREAGVDRGRSRPWKLGLADRVLLVGAYWRTNLTVRELAPLFRVSKSAGGRMITDLAPHLALTRRAVPGSDAALIMDGTLSPTRDRTVAASSKNYRYSEPSGRTRGRHPASRSWQHDSTEWGRRKRGSRPAVNVVSRLRIGVGESHALYGASASSVFRAAVPSP